MWQEVLSKIVAGTVAAAVVVLLIYLVIEAFWFMANRIAERLDERVAEKRKNVLPIAGWRYKVYHSSSWSLTDNKDLVDSLKSQGVYKMEELYAL